MTNITNRDISLDIIKGIAIFLVVMQHTGSYINEGIHFICITDIPLFFIVSGYLAYKPTIDRKRLLIGKAKTILLPYVIAIIFAVIWYDISFPTLFSDIGRKGYWFLQALFILFCIYALIHNLFNSLKKTIVAVVIIELLLLLGSKYLSPNIDAFLGLSYLSRYFPCFFAGVIIRNYKVSDTVVKSNYNIGGIACIIVTAVAFTNRFTTNLSFLLYVVGYLTSAIYLFFFIRNVSPHWPNIICRFFSFIGRYSLSIYIIHFYFIWKIPNYFDSFIPNFIVTVIISLIIVIASMCISKILTFATPLKHILPN